ncbi:glycosyltransferase family 1 protein [Aspergillus carbonarius ITEM 5010]|uniref:Glycosyltransferase family 1 protein n=1 Tax=Aspergillus carbonarius (strain ITEM 5010) TaxID=602072 RepID=A0A1R3RPP8_ASPC5|nr:glycosyltransferase family 1 protein [Aspergillus carbonarius ITEM 5010]
MSRLEPSLMVGEISAAIRKSLEQLSPEKFRAGNRWLQEVQAVNGLLEVAPAFDPDTLYVNDWTKNPFDQGSQKAGVRYVQPGVPRPESARDDAGLVADFFVDAVKDMEREYQLPIAIVWPQMLYMMVPFSYIPGQPGFQLDMPPCGRELTTNW